MSALIDIKTECAGKVALILKSLGYEESIFSGKHQPCPFCGGKDRARWVKAKEYLHCNQCGPVGFMDMAISITGENYGRTAKIIRGEDLNRMEPIKQTDDTAKNQARIDKIRAGLKPLTGDCLASRYLAGRGINVLPDKDCYFHAGVDYWQDDKKTVIPAMVSIFRNLEGKGSTFHITYLSQDGKKADVDAPKKILPVVLPLAGCAIQLFSPGQGVLAVAEGIETALAVYALEGVPVWASGNAGQMESMQIPDSVNEVWIYADSDENFTGQKAAYVLANKLAIKGKKVRVCSLIDQAWLTDSGVKYDFLDLLNSAQLGSAAQ